MKHKAKPSASLPIGSYQWAIARLAEVGTDAYALNIKLEHEAPQKPVAKNHKTKI